MKNSPQALGLSFPSNELYNGEIHLEYFIEKIRHFIAFRTIFANYANRNKTINASPKI